MEDIVCRGRCPNCGKRLKFLFPYNVDLYRNTVICICSRCGIHIRASFDTGGHGVLGRLQGIFRPQYYPTIEVRN